MVLGVGYLVIGVLAVDPIRKHTSITVDLADSSGLTSGSDVVYRGVNIGRVEGVTGRAGGVRVRQSRSVVAHLDLATEAPRRPGRPHDRHALQDGRVEAGR
ncbi:MlaD family protein [Gordonia jinghuaiqii]|nr:MlaD family protein [Gordonia jinghuaiqii]